MRAGTVDAKDFAYGLVCHSYPKSLASYMKRINDLPGNARISRKEYFNFARMLLAIDDVEVQCFPSIMDLRANACHFIQGTCLSPS